MNLIIYSNRGTSDQDQDEIKGTEVQTSFSRKSRIRRGERFLKGPIPLRDIAAASRLTGKSLALFLAVHHQIALTGKPIITLPSKLLSDLGISRGAKARGLALLENTGLITVTRSRGRAARIQFRRK